MEIAPKNISGIMVSLCSAQCAVRSALVLRGDASEMFLSEY
jgi:hypothetical protein